MLHAACCAARARARRKKKKKGKAQWHLSEEWRPIGKKAQKENKVHDREKAGTKKRNNLMISPPFLSVYPSPFPSVAGIRRIYTVGAGEGEANSMNMNMNTN